MALKRMSLNLDEDLEPWTAFAAGLEGKSVTGYINAAIRRERDNAPEKVKRAFDAFIDARSATAPEED